MLSMFFIYTAFKAVQLVPAHAVLAVISAIVIFVLMFGTLFIHRANISVFDRIWFRLMAWIGSILMAGWATFIFLSLPVDIVNGILRVFHLHNAALFRHIELGLLTVSVVLMFIGVLQMRGGPRVKKVSISMPNLPSDLSKLKIAHFTDLHVSPTLRRGYVERVVQLINATEPDFIFFTGDLADAHVSSIARHLEPLRGLKSRYGRFFVTGNHEYYWGVNELVSLVRNLGFTALLNENKIIPVGNQNLLVAGVTDHVGHMVDGHAPDMERASATSTTPDFKILLAHRPDAYEQAEPRGFDLQFSGHTHAGQFFPFNLMIGLFHKYSRGLYQHGRMWLYVNPGTGYWGPPDRLGVTPEITLLTLG